MGKRGRARTRAAPAGRRRECVQGKNGCLRKNGVSFYRLLQKGSSQKKKRVATFKDVQTCFAETREKRESEKFSAFLGVCFYET